VAEPQLSLPESIYCFKPTAGCTIHMVYRAHYKDNRIYDPVTIVAVDVGNVKTVTAFLSRS
jgi:hypothetical protein